MPKISVCIPTYNRASLLRQSINSVLAQDMTDWELNISDNASTDETVAVVNSYNDSRIHLIQQPKNMGMFKNYNAVARMASGEYIKMLMDDDVLLPTCLRRQVETLNTFPSANFVCSDYSAIDGDNRPIHSIHFHEDTYRIFQESRLEKGESLILQFLLGKRTIGLPSAITFRRSAAAEIGFFDEQIGICLDTDLWLRLCIEGDFYYLDEKLLYLRWHTNESKEFASGSVGYRDLFDLSQKHWQLHAHQPVFKKNKDKIFQRLVTLMLPYFVQASKDDRRLICGDFKKLPLSVQQRLALQIRLNLILLLHPGK